MTELSTQKQQPYSNLHFRLMAPYLAFRERFRKPEQTLRKLGIGTGHKILDFGCGIGSYSIPATRLVGEEGFVYALDIHPLAIERVNRRIEQAGITNCDTILSGLYTGLSDHTIDIVLMFDVFHWVKEKDKLLMELHRVLEDSGKMLVLVDHVEPEDCRDKILQSDLFELIQHEDNLLGFRKAQTT